MSIPGEKMPAPFSIFMPRMFLPLLLVLCKVDYSTSRTYLRESRKTENEDSKYTLSDSASLTSDNKQLSLFETQENDGQKGVDRSLQWTEEQQKPAYWDSLEESLTTRNCEKYGINCRNRPRMPVQRYDGGENRETRETDSYKFTIGAKQKDPIKINKYITCVDTITARAHAREKAIVPVPKHTKEGDLLLMFIGGSASGRMRPSDPSGKGWECVMDAGPNDINLKVCHKEYSPKDDDEYRITDGKSTFVILTVLRGVDLKNPVVDVDATRNSNDGKCGEAKTPRISTSKQGAIIGVFLFDDPLLVEITNDSFNLVSSFQSGDDGMALGISDTDGGRHKSIHTISKRCRRGGGNDIAMAISLRKK